MVKKISATVIRTPRPSSVTKPVVLVIGADDAARSAYDALAKQDGLACYFLTAQENYRDTTLAASAEDDKVMQLAQDSVDPVWHTQEAMERLDALRPWLLHIRPDAVLLHDPQVTGMEVLPYLKAVLPDARLICALSEALLPGSEDFTPGEQLLGRQFVLEHLRYADACVCEDNALGKRFQALGVTAQTTTNLSEVLCPQN